MMEKLKLIKRSEANDLNEKWDSLTENYYQTKEFLVHCEKYNPCKQRYYELYEDEGFIAGAIVYSLDLNIFTYSKFNYKFRMNIIGIPVSVSSQGFIGKKEDIEKLILKTIGLEKGFLLGLNMDFKPDIKGVSIGHTLPTIILDKKFTGWEDYLVSVRKSKRRRIRIICNHMNRIKIEKKDCKDFNEKMYELYINVYNKSSEKLERLDIEFFKNLPNRFTLKTFKLDDKIIGWHITLKDNDRFIFFLGGIDYDHNQEYRLYFNLTIDILKSAIEQGYGSLDFGQTAEIPKCYLGGKLTDKYMFGHHSNNFLNTALKMFKRSLEYKKNIPEIKVFREKNEK